MSMRVVISIDVEEEGLFSGRYPRSPPGVSNVEELRRLEFVPREFGLPLTLLATYPVITSEPGRRVLTEWRDRFGAEIGAHLHPWCTPPFDSSPWAEPVPLKRMAAQVVRRKLETLVHTHRQAFGEQPRVFRMGRFDQAPYLPALLTETGFVIDSSIAPLTCRNGDRAPFLAPSDPYRLPTGRREILVEVPVTVIPVSPSSARLVWQLASILPMPLGDALLDRFRFVGAVGMQPARFPLVSMRVAASLHRRRGGRVLHLCLHSSELKPGASPRFRTEADVARLVGKLRAFIEWLVERGPIEGSRLSDFGGFRPT